MKKKYLFYTLVGNKSKNAAMMVRGIFDRKKDAIKEAEKCAEFEIRRHVEIDGKRVENELVKVFFDFTA